MTTIATAAIEKARKTRTTTAATQCAANHHRQQPQNNACRVTQSPSLQCEGRGKRQRWVVHAMEPRATAPCCATYLETSAGGIPGPESVTETTMRWVDLPTSTGKGSPPAPAFRGGAGRRGGGRGGGGGEGPLLVGNESLPLLLIPRLRGTRIPRLRPSKGDDVGKRGRIVSRPVGGGGGRGTGAIRGKGRPKETERDDRKRPESEGVKRR